MPVYFAYGSNLHPPQMSERCPGAEVLGTAVLPGFRLGFSGHSPRWGGGVATLLRDPNHEAQGLLYTLSEENFHQLDRFEGFPTVYTRIEITVQGQDGTPLPALTYQKRSTDVTPPSLLYFHQIWKSYRAFQLNESQLFQAIETSLNGNGASGVKQYPSPA